MSPNKFTLLLIFTIQITSLYSLDGNPAKNPIPPVDLEVAFIYPNRGDSIVGLNEKLELGIKLPIHIQKVINEFLNDSQLNYLNPYDPDQVNMEAIFSNGADSFKVFGFYYREFDRDLRTNNSWKEVFTNYFWRIRFAPPTTGTWNCIISVDFPHSEWPALKSNAIKFNCIDKGKKGFLTVANDQKYLTYHRSNEPFFAIGQNIPWTDEPIFNGRWLDYNENNFNVPNKSFSKLLYNVGFMDILHYVENTADNNGNMLRTVSWHNSYLYEWEEKGVYGSNRHPTDQNFLRQKRAWELDKLFETAELRDVKLLFCLEFQGQFTYDWNGGDANSYLYNPYNKTEINNVILNKEPIDFFSDPAIIKDYKKKLRYFIARWGYSPSLGIFQLLSEFDGWSVDKNQPHKKMNTILDKDVKLQQNIRNWHDEIGSYIHEIAYRPMIITSGFMTNTKPTDFPSKRNLYDSPHINMVIWNKYGNDRSINYEMNKYAQHIMHDIQKPFLFTETGIIMNPETNADPGDIDGCSDVMFHNFAWAGATMGCAGTSLNWWQAFDDKRRINYKALATFFDSIPLTSQHYNQNETWSDNGTGLYLCGNVKRLFKKSSFIEAYYVKGSGTLSKKKYQSAYGWVHNLSNYWGNITDYTNCLDRNNHSPKNNNCSDDEYNNPQSLLKLERKIKLKGFTPNTNYIFSWYSCYGNGGMISKLDIKSNGYGTIELSWPGNDFDYAFTLTAKPK